MCIQACRSVFPLSGTFPAVVPLLCIGHVCLAAPFPAAASFQLHPGLTLELFAREPHVVDPVGMAFDEAGRCFVLEMRDYPLGVGPDHRPGGVIRILEDVDGDGMVDRSHLFAEGLSFPTSILPWNGGVLVTAPPEILFLKDTDGDHKADVRTVMFSGFKLGVTDSNMNGLRWGLDNRVHGLNGGNGGRVVAPGAEWPAVDLRDADFSFDPSRRDLQRTFQTGGGFGLVIDSWGRRFTTYNINHLLHQVLPLRYLERTGEALPPFETTVSISDHGDMARIYPIATAQTRVNHPEQAGHFSSAGGMGFIGLAGYPGDLPGSVLVCDVVSHLVHRDLIVPEGPGFIGRRPPGEETSEFFASRDPLFRPVGLETGPDGALYLLDMQRAVIEHPDYIPERVKSRIDLREGSDRGRIYRITPKSGLPRVAHDLRGLSVDARAALLSHPNPWWRSTAQRLLVAQGGSQVESAIRRHLASGAPPLGRLHARWALHGIGAWTQVDAMASLADDVPELLENALQMAETLPGPPAAVRERVVALCSHDHARVRFQAALTLGWMGAGGEAGLSALRSVWARDHAWRWSRVAVMAGMPSGAGELLREFIVTPASAKDRLEAVSELAQAAGRQWDFTREGAVSEALVAMAGAGFPATVRRAAVDGLQAGVVAARRTGDPAGSTQSALRKLFSTGEEADRLAAFRLGRALRMPPSPDLAAAVERGLAAAVDRRRPAALRIRDIAFLEFATEAASRPALLGLINSVESSEVQRAAWGLLKGSREGAVASGLLERWRGLAPGLRVDVIQALTSRRSWHDALLESLEKGTVHAGELNLDLEQRRHLLRQAVPANQVRAAKFFADEEYANRKALVEQWLPRVPGSGDPAKGRDVFMKNCASCHRSRGEGHDVGPDLSDLSHRSVEDLVSNILDPNMALNPAFVSVLIETREGDLVSGVMDSESEGAVVLRQAQGLRVRVARSDIVKLEFTGKSLMPEGLESVLTPETLGDLAAFLQRPPAVAR